MAGITLYDYQKDALERMKIGCILCGGVGSGKSRTSLAFYYTLCGGAVNTQNYVKMHDPPDLYIITTARKRDTGEWEEELAHFYMSTDSNLDIYDHTVIDTKPDSEMTAAMSLLAKASYDSHFISDNLYHDVFSVWY